MRRKLQSIIAIFLSFILIWSIESSSESSKYLAYGFSNVSEEAGADESSNSSVMREPITKEYFENLMNSKETFSRIHLDFVRRKDGMPSGLMIDSKTETTEENYLSKKYSEIESFWAYFVGFERRWRGYTCDIPSETISPIFDLIMLKSDYYFNAEEYRIDKDFDKRKIWSGSYKNYVVFVICQRNGKADKTCIDKSFCKGWNEGEEPPEELQPLVDYLETVVIPLLKEHPEQLDENAIS